MRCIVALAGSPSNVPLQRVERAESAVQPRRVCRHWCPTVFWCGGWSGVASNLHRDGSSPGRCVATCWLSSSSSGSGRWTTARCRASVRAPGRRRQPCAAPACARAGPGAPTCRPAVSSRQGGERHKSLERSSASCQQVTKARPGRGRLTGEDSRGAPRLKASARTQLRSLAPKSGRDRMWRLRYPSAHRGRSRTITGCSSGGGAVWRGNEP